MEAGLIALIVIAVVVLFLAARTVRIVPQSRAGVVERLGRYQRTLGPGLSIVIPFVDKVRQLTDLREQVVSFPPQPVITEDNVSVGVDTVLYFTITDPKAELYEVANSLTAIEQLTVTTLRNIIGSLTLEQVLTSRDQVNDRLRIVLDERTGPWGIRVNGVELKAVEPPRSIQEAMEKQMRAERDHRASILTAEGEKASAVLSAEGSQQARRPARPGRQGGGGPARPGRGRGHPERLQGHPRRQARPGAALLPVPADAAQAGRRAGQQGLGHPVRVLPGIGQPGRRAGPRDGGR